MKKRNDKNVCRQTSSVNSCWIQMNSKNKLILYRFDFYWQSFTKKVYVIQEIQIFNWIFRRIDKSIIKGMNWIFFKVPKPNKKCLLVILAIMLQQ